MINVRPLLFLLILVCCWPAAAAEPVDVRLVIDVSGSMKSTDPENLRIPALELVVKLLPENSRAGIWTFANDVEPLVRGASAWALGRIGDEAGLIALSDRLACEEDPHVRQELERWMHGVR